MDCKPLKALADARRADALTMISLSKTGAIGEAMAQLDLLACLYYDALRLRPDVPGWPERDRFVLDSGMDTSGYYAMLADLGYFPRAWLASYAQAGCSLAAHLSAAVPGVDAAPIAAGDALTIAAGMAMRLAQEKKAAKVYALIGRQAMASDHVQHAMWLAGRRASANLTVILSYTKPVAEGSQPHWATAEALAAQWQDAGWRVALLDGHDIVALQSFFSSSQSNGGPRCLIARTTLGKGIPFAEDSPHWQGSAVTDAQLRKAYASLGVQGVQWA